MKAHPFFKLGKKKPKTDKRTLKFSSIVRAMLAVPVAYSVDQKYPGIKETMDGNDQEGDCVMAARAKFTRRAKFAETGTQILISVKEILKEYFLETGGPDSGLVILDSLKLWRSKGWIAGGKRLFLKAFAVLDRSPAQFKQTIFADLGCIVGVSLPAIAQREMNAGRGWSITTGPGSQPGSWGGHCIYAVGYDQAGITFCTWGLYQHATWAWVAKYCDEAYMVVDRVDTTKVKKLLHMDKLNEALEKAAA